MIEKVKEVIEKQIKPALMADGGDIKLIDVKNGIVKVKLSGACAACPMSKYTMKNFVESTLKKQIPEVNEVFTV